VATTTAREATRPPTAQPSRPGCWQRSPRWPVWRCSNGGGRASATSSRRCQGSCWGARTVPPARAVDQAGTPPVERPRLVHRWWRPATPREQVRHDHGRLLDAAGRCGVPRAPTSSPASGQVLRSAVPDLGEAVDETDRCVRRGPLQRPPDRGAHGPAHPGCEPAPPPRAQVPRGYVEAWFQAKVRRRLWHPRVQEE
jgi:hypothetical protein